MLVILTVVSLMLYEMNVYQSCLWGVYSLLATESFNVLHLIYKRNFRFLHYVRILCSVLSAILIIKAYGEHPHSVEIWTDIQLSSFIVGILGALASLKRWIQ